MTTETVRQVPATDAVSLKRFFKERFGIPVRVRTSPTKSKYINVWIPSNKRSSFNEPLSYSHHFPFEELGRRCLEAIYPNNPTLHDHWCGNVEPHSISMVPKEWERVLQVLEATDTV